MNGSTSTFPAPTGPEAALRLQPRWAHQEWMADAECKGQTHHFFAPHGEQAEAREHREAIARSICVRCPVLATCREYARCHREQGFWGAENDDQRLEARRRPQRYRLVPAATDPSVASQS